MFASEDETQVRLRFAEHSHRQDGRDYNIRKNCSSAFGLQGVLTQINGRQINLHLKLELFPTSHCA